MEKKEVKVSFGINGWLTPTLVIISIFVNLPRFLGVNTPAAINELLLAWQGAESSFIVWLWKCFDGWSAIPFCIITPFVIGICTFIVMIVGVFVVAAIGALFYRIFISKRNPIKW